MCSEWNIKNQGLGAAVAHALAEKGCNLTLFGRSQNKHQEIAHMLEKTYAIVCETLVVDLATIPDFGPKKFDLIINNAVDAHCEAFSEESEEAMRRSFEINFFAPWKILKQYAPAMERGMIVNIATASSRAGLPYFSTYNATKAALWTLSEALTREFRHVKVMTFIPPHMATQTALGLGRKAFGFFHYSPSKSVQVEHVAQQLKHALLKKRNLFVRC